MARQSVDHLREFFQSTGIGDWEIIVVDDGGGDFPADPWKGDASVRLLQLPQNRGKGAAVVAGVRAATGAVRVITDVDLPYGVALLPSIADYLSRGFHMVIGDRTLPTSRYQEDLSWQRRMVSGFASKLIGTVVTGGFFDTQCGIKGIRGDIADLVFPLVHIEGFAFDVELIYIALLHGLDIKRMPVRLQSNTTSSVRVGRDSLRGMRDILRIKRRQVRGLYQSPALSHLVLAEIESVMASQARRTSDLQHRSHDDTSQRS